LAESRINKKWQVGLKIALTLLAFYLAFDMVNQEDLIDAVKRADKVLFVAALILYVLSQAVSSERLRLFIKKFKGAHHIGSLWNFRLYLVGMSYNLFLPGGLGGDAYKLVVYRKKLNPGKRRVFMALVLDRVSGGIAILLCLAVIPIYRSMPFEQFYGIWWWIPAFLTFVAGYFIVRKGFKRFLPVYFPAAVLSVVIQSMQAGAMLLLVGAVGMNDHQLTIVVVFLLSSLATAIPIFLGGLGAREVVFAALAGTFGYAATEAVTASLLFSAIVIISSVPGLFLSFTKS